VTGDDAEAIVHAAQRGDGAALDELLSRYQPHILRFGMKMCGDVDDAQDVLQETLLAAARTLPGFRGASTLSTWLYAIARSFCIKKRRRSVFAPEVVSLDSEAARAGAAPDRAPDPERSLAAKEVATALESAIAGLEPAYREVLLLRDVEGLSAAEAAEVTGLTVAAVKSRLHRARREVRDRLVPLLVPAPLPLPAVGEACPDVVDLLSRHLEGDIAPETCAEMEHHVSACPRCRGACDSLRRTLQLCGSAPSAEVPEALKRSIREGIRTLLAERGGKSEP
jgi:RNA polymerase sigma-70 factor (ECF subfamily)